MVHVPAALGDRYPHLQFRRRWTIGADVHYRLGQCDAIIRAIRDAPLSPERRRELCEVALVKGAQATTAIEGNTLTDAEVRQVADGGRLAPSKEYQEREVRNVIDAMNGIAREVGAAGWSAPVAPALLREFHRRIGAELGEHFDAIPGRFRTDERFVGPYRCPRATDVERLVDLLCAWLAEEFSPAGKPLTFRDAVTQAIVAHVYIEWIHPFGDGNGRTGRLVEFYLLLRAGNPEIASHILSNFYNLTRSEYYRQLQQASTGRDLGGFIAYAVEGYRDGLLETLRTVREEQFEVAWRALIHERFAAQRYRKKRVFRRRRELMLHFPLDEPIALSQLPLRTIELARQYSALTETTLLRDVKVLMDMDLVVRDPETGGYRAHTGLLRGNQPGPADRDRPGIRDHTN